MVNYPYSKEEIDMKKYSVWKRLGSLVLALVLVMSLMPATHTHAHAEAISGGTKLFLKPNANWTRGGAWFAMYLWGNGGSIWASMTDSDSDGVYEGTAPAGSWTGVIFCRMNPATTVNDWSSTWDQTVDLTFDGTNNTATIPDGNWNNTSVNWSHTHVWNAEEGTCFCGEECDHFESDMVEEKPTCVSIGWLRYTCRTCGYKWSSPGGNPEPENDAAHVWQRTGSGTRGVCEASYTCYNDPEHTKTVPFAAHSFTDGVCTNCGYGCDHIAAMADSVCTVCGWECDHPSWTESSGYATCRYCGIDAVARVVDTFYLDIEEALAKAQETDDCTLTLYQNVSGLTEALTISKGNFTILGNSNTLSGTIEGPVLKITGGTVLLKSLKVENPSTAAASRAVEITGGNVTVRGGEINAGHSGIFIPQDSDPTVTLVGGTITADRGVDNNSAASTLNLGADAEAGPTIQGTTYGVSSRGKVLFKSGSVSGEYGFYLAPGASVTLYDEYSPIIATTAHFFIAGAPTGELNFRYAPSEGKYKIEATLPGTFAKPDLSTVELDPAGFISVTKDLLLAKDGNDLILKRCGHETFESEATCKAGAICAICGTEVGTADPDAHIFDPATGKCGNGCGLEMAAASTTVGSTTTYYLTVKAALDAASQAETATVNLLRSDENVTGLTMMGGNVRLEMNGLTLKGSVSKNGILQLFGAKLSVVGGTVENTAADGYGIYAAYNESTHRYSTIDVDSSTVTGGDAGIVTYKADVSLARGTVTGTRFGIAAQNSGEIALESGTVRGDVGVCTNFYGGILTLGAEGTDGPTVYGQTCGIATNYNTTAYSGTIHCPEGIGIRLGGHYSSYNESAGAGLDLKGTPTINAATDIYLDYDKTLVKSRYIQVYVALTDGAYSVDCQMDIDVIAKPGTGITLQRTWFTSANANKFVQHSAHGYLGLGPCAHGDKKAVQNEDGVTHDVFCNICQTTPEEDVPCSGGTATCKNKAVCTACGEQYGELADHIIDPDTGKCSLCNTDLAVALVELNDTITYYATMQEALDAVQTATASQDATVLLRKEHKANSYLFIRGGEFTLDLGGNTLDVRSYGMDMNAGQVQIVNGKIIGDYLYVMQIKDGKLTVGSDATLQSIEGERGFGSVLLISGGEAILDGGILTTDQAIGVYADGGNFTLTSGKVEHTGSNYAIFIFEGTVLLNGGTVTGGHTTIYVKSGDNTLTLGGTEVQHTATKNSDVAIVQGGGTVNLNSGTVSSGSSVVLTTGGTLKVGGTVMIPAAGGYHVYAGSEVSLLNFSKATGKEYKIYAGGDLSTAAIAYDSEKHLLTYTDTDITDNSYAKNTVVTLGCPHKNTTAAPNGDGTHNITCDDCDATVTENEACSGGTATCIAKAKCAKCETEYGQLGGHGAIDPATGKCSLCNTDQAVASATLNGTTTYYPGLQRAIEAVRSATASDNATVTLLKEHEADNHLFIMDGVFTLDLGGNTLSCKHELAINGGDVKLQNGTLASVDTSVIAVHDGRLTVAQNATVENTGDDTIINALEVRGGTAILDGGTLISAQGKAAVSVNSGTFTLTSGKVEHTGSGVGIQMNGGTVNLNGGSVSSASRWAVHVINGTLKVKGTALNPPANWYDVRINFSSGAELDFTAATGTKYTVEVKGSDPLPLANLTYSTEKYSLTHTDTDISDGSFAIDTVITLSCAHNGTTAAPNGDGTHKVTCSNCGATVAESEACSGGTATCIAKAECAKCETEYGQLLEHAMDAATGKCKYDCGLLMAEAYVRVGNDATYYLTFEEAFANTMRTHSLCLVKDATVESALSSVNMCELFLNGHTLTLDQGMTVDTLKLSGSGGTLKGGSDCEVLLQVTGDLKLVNVSVLAECEYVANAATLTLGEATLSSDRAEIYITEFPSSGPAIYFKTPYSGSALRVEFPENMNPLGMLLAKGDYYLPEDQIEIFNEGYTVRHLPSDGTDGCALYVCADLADAQVKNAPFAITYGEDIQGLLPELTLLGRTLTKDIDYTLTYPTVTGVGTVNIIATGTGRYVGELKIPVTVNKAAPKYSDFTISSPADLVYNGQPKVPQIDTTRTGMGQWTVRYLDVEKSTLESNAVDAGTYQIVLNVAEGENYTDSTVTDPSWTFQITKADVTLRMQEPNTTTPYATSKPVQIIATGVDGTILGAEVTLRMIDNGREVREDERKTVDSTGTATYENLSEKESGEFMKPGTYTVRASIAESKNHKAADFTQLGTYTITKADLTVTKTSEGSSNKYGHNLYGVASVTGVTGDVNGLSIQLQLKNAEGAVVSSMTQAVSAGKIVWNWLNELPGGGYADAGEYTIVAKFDGNAIYEASETNLGTYTILPTPATVTAADQTITLGESISTDEDRYEVEGLLVGYRLVGINFDYKNDQVTASGEIIPMDAVIKRGDVDVTANYAITYKSGKLIVKPDASLVENLEVETVTSEDLPDIEEFLEQMENAESTEEEWDDLRDHANDLADRVEDAAAMADTDVDDLTEDTVRPETVEEAEDIQGELEAAKEQLERAKESFGDNYTDEEETAMEDELERVEDLLDKLEKVKPFIEAINELPETAEPDDEEAIRKLLEAVAIGDRIGEEARALAGNMDDFLAFFQKLTTYRITMGDGGKYTKGSGEELSFTANGPAFGQEVYFAALYIDGERVDAENYTVTAGSTIVALKSAYLESLKVGKHTIYFGYQFAGIAVNSDTAEFEVLKKPSRPGGNSGNTNPDTGDLADMTLWLGMMAVSTLALASLLLLKKRKSAK